VYTNLFLGDNNWVAIRSALEKVRYDGWIIAEMESVYRHAQDQQFFDTSAAMSRFNEGRM
jgi:sugar phosphate isomerase/epimerase